MRPGPWGKDQVGALESDTKKIFGTTPILKIENAHYFQTFVHVKEYG